MDGDLPQLHERMSDDGRRLLFESEVAVLAGVETAVRHCVEEAVADEFPDQPTLNEEVALVTSELVANAIRVARDQIVVRVVAQEDAVTVEVTDDGPGVPQMRDPDPDDPTGRGLLLVAAVADRWGTEPNGPQAKTVWACLSTRSG